MRGSQGTSAARPRIPGQGRRQEDGGGQGNSSGNSRRQVPAQVPPSLKESPGLSWSSLEVVWPPAQPGSSKEPPGGPRSFCSHMGPGSCSWTSRCGTFLRTQPCARQLAGYHQGNGSSSRPVRWALPRVIDADPWRGLSWVSRLLPKIHCQGKKYIYFYYFLKILFVYWRERP